MQSSQYSTAYISIGTKGKKAIGISKIEKDLEIISLILLSVYTDKHEKNHLIHSCASQIKQHLYL